MYIIGEGSIGHAIGIGRTPQEAWESVLRDTDPDAHADYRAAFDVYPASPELVAAIRRWPQSTAYRVRRGIAVPR